MKIESLNLPGTFLISPTLHEDDRGFFTELYNYEKFKELGLDIKFDQDSTSYSKQDVIRGLHFQTGEHAQDKLVRCSRGQVMDVAADIDPGSPTYGQYVQVDLSEDNQSMFFIPGKYAHGFAVTEGPAVVEYKLTGKFVPEFASGVMYNDEILAIDWSISEPIISDKDNNWTPLPAK